MNKPAATKIVTIVTMDEFWEAMCKPGFRRISRNQGTLHGEMLYTPAPPEEVPGFLEGKIYEVKDALRLDYRVTRYPLFAFIVQSTIVAAFLIWLLAKVIEL